jgi:hypothetical protein
MEPGPVNTVACQQATIELGGGRRATLAVDALFQPTRRRI